MLDFEEFCKAAVGVYSGPELHKMMRNAGFAGVGDTWRSGRETI